MRWRQCVALVSKRSCWVGFLATPLVACARSFSLLPTAETISQPALPCTPPNRRLRQPLWSCTKIHHGCAWADPNRNEIKRRHQPLALGISSKQAHAFGRALYLKSWALDADNPLGSPFSQRQKKNTARKKKEGGMSCLRLHQNFCLWC